MSPFKAIAVAMLATLAFAACTTAPVAQSPNGSSTVVAGAQATPEMVRPTVTAADHPSLGTILVDVNGMVLYRYANDQVGVSNCKDQCAQNWPSLTVSGTPVMDPVVPGTLGTSTRDDGTTQVTYNGMPLYYFVKDVSAGDTNGDRLNDVWFVVNPTEAP